MFPSRAVPLVGHDWPGLQSGFCNQPEQVGPQAVDSGLMVLLAGLCVQVEPQTGLLDQMGCKVVSMSGQATCCALLF